MAMEERTDIIVDSALTEADETTDALDPSEGNTESVIVPINQDSTDSLVGVPPSDDVLALLNDKLIQEARHIRTQWELIQERLAKIEESKGKIKESVYSKVAGDYRSRMQETQQTVISVKGEIDQELAKLRHQEAEVTRQVMEHEDTLEEAQFRHELGEYTDADFKEISVKEQSILDEARSKQDNLQEGISQYESIFEGIKIDIPPAPAPTAVEEELDTVEPAPLPPSPAKAATTAAPEAEPEDYVPPVMPNVGTSAPRAVDKQGARAPKVTETPEVSEQAAPEPENTTPQAMTASLNAAVSSAAPTPSQNATLVLYEKNQATGQFPIEKEITIGRSPSNEVVLKEPRISRRHAVIRHSGNEYLVIDNNSSNGTYVNGTAVTEQVLHAGDKLQIGSFEMVFNL